MTVSSTVRRASTIFLIACAAVVLCGQPAHAGQSPVAPSADAVKATIAEARKLVDGGLIGHVGVSNHGLSQWQAAETAFGGAILSNQVQFSLAARAPERAGKTDRSVTVCQRYVNGSSNFSFQAGQTIGWQPCGLVLVSR